MSSSSIDSLADAFPKGFSLTGGVPLEKQDLAASIIFTIAFVLLLPAIVWRWSRRCSRTWLLLRPTLVAMFRIATYIIRAIESKGNYSEGLFIAEQVLLLAGLVPLLEPLVGLLRSHVRRYWTPVPPSQQTEEQRRGDLLARALRILQLAVFVALILAIVAGTKAGSATSDPNSADELRHYRYATIGLSIFILGVTAIVNGAIFLRDSLPLSGTLYIFGMCGLLLIPNVYKLVVSLHPPGMFSVGTKTAFYLLSALPEWLAIVLYFSVNLNDLFAVQETSWKDKVEKKMKKGAWPEGLGYVPRDEYERRESGGQYEMGMQQQGWKA
ncbi:hypothetical protein JCM8097_001726 [Rhodosporidiobolus ruineniae]